MAKKAKAAKKKVTKSKKNTKNNTKKKVAKKVQKTKSAKVLKKTTKKKVVKKVKAKKTASKTKAVKSKTKIAPAKTATTSKNLSSGLKIGQVVPDFTAKSTSGDFKLSSFKGKNVVLYFYPKDNTPGCTLEGHDFSEALSKFSEKNTVVFGISKDSVTTHQGFINKQNYKHHLISDENENVCQIFGVIKEKSMYGRTYLGIDRSTFLIDANGVLKAEWRNVKVNGHVAEVLAKI